MSGGDISTPIVFRGLNGPAASVAAQHSQCMASLLANVPGMHVVSPYDAKDFKGLLKSSIRNDNPVMFLENEKTYGISHEVGDEFFRDDFLIPIGKAEVLKKGNDVTIVAYSFTVHLALEA